MIGVVKILIIAIASVFLGYFLKSFEREINPNYRWIEIFNNTDCKIALAEVLLPDRSIVVRSDQVEHSLYPFNGESDVNIPVLISEDIYQVRISFDDCPVLIGEPQDFHSGLHAHVFVSKDGMRYGAR